MKRRVTVSSLLVLTLLLSLIGVVTTAMLTPQPVFAQGIPSPAPSRLFLIEIGGDRVVYDAAKGTYWYPHLLNMIQMTKDEQQDYIDQLNADAYGQITDWHFASLEQMIALMESMTGQTLIPGEVNWAYNITTTAYFPFTDSQVTPMGTCKVTMGRTIDEWAKREDPATAPPWIPTVHDSIYGEGEYHWFVFPDGSMIFDDDLNWIPDDALLGPSPHPPGQPPGSPIECSAWVVSETGPMFTAPGAGGLSGGAQAGIAVGGLAAAIACFVFVLPRVGRMSEG